MNNFEDSIIGDTGGSEPAATAPRGKALWMRGLVALILVLLVQLAQTVLCIIAVLQFGWMLFAGARNDGLARLGASLGQWLAETSRFVSAESEDKPFPWGAWR